MYFLQLKPFEFYLIMGAGFIGLIILLLLVRWVFSVGKRVKHEEARTRLLFRIAEKMGVSKDEIDDIKKDLL